MEAGPNIEAGQARCKSFLGAGADNDAVDGETPGVRSVAVVAVEIYPLLNPEQHTHGPCPLEPL